MIVVQCTNPACPHCSGTGKFELSSATGGRKAIATCFGNSFSLDDEKEDAVTILPAEAQPTLPQLPAEAGKHYEWQDLIKLKKNGHVESFDPHDRFEIINSLLENIRDLQAPHLPVSDAVALKDEIQKAIAKHKYPFAYGRTKGDKDNGIEPTGLHIWMIDASKAADEVCKLFNAPLHRGEGGQE